MLRGPIGVIFGETGSLDFKFAAADGQVISRTGYVKVWHESNGWVLAQVISVTRSSEAYSLDTAISAAEGAQVRGADEKIVAKANVIGSRNAQGMLMVPKTPFSPGDRVYEADRELVQSTLGLSLDGIYLGLLQGHDVPVHLDVNKLVQKHCSILARTGSGKSYTAGVIIEELIEHDVPLLIIDPHGEYVSLRYENTDLQGAERFGIIPKSYRSKVVVYTPANLTLNKEADKVFRLDEINLSAKSLAQMLAIDSNIQMGILHQAVSRVKEKIELYTIDDIINVCKEDKSKAKWNVINALESLRETGILSSSPTTVDELIKRGRASIIDMGGVTQELQGIIVARLCNELFQARKRGKIPPAMLVVEEAHNFCPEKGLEKSVSSNILRTIASEGRKFGLGIMVVSQRPARIDKNVLSQCNAQIILKVTNPNDLRAISKGLEGFYSGMEEEIRRLQPGVALVVSNDIEHPILVDIRTRKSKHGGKSIPIVTKEDKRGKRWTIMSR